MSDNNLDYKKAYEEILEKFLKKEKQELLEKERQELLEKERQELLEKERQEHLEKQKEKEKEFSEKLLEKDKEKELLEKEKERRKKERSIRHLIDNGIPKCIITSTSQSSLNHDLCRLEPSTWVGIPNFEYLLEKNGDKKSSVLALYRSSDNTFTARNEYELYNFANPIIKDALKLCGLEDEISIVSQEDIAGLKPDYWLLKSKTNYIGLIEVKCNEDSFRDPKVIGQMFDYLMGLSYHFGKLQAFGLLLTYNKAMPLFTYDSLKLASTNIQTTLPHATSALPDKINQTAKIKLNLKVPRRVLYTSNPPVIGIENPKEFFGLICSTIFKMRDSQFDPSKEGTDFRIYLQASSSCFKAKSVEISTRKDLTNLKEIDKKLLDEIYLVKSLGGGGDGHCSFALTEEGHSLVIKSFNKTINQEKRDEERRLWHTIWGIETVIKTYAAKDHLVMPFIKPIGYVDYNSTGFMDLISTAADTFSSKGYEHMDLYVRHICKYKKNDGQYKYIFIDLSRVSKVTDKDQAKQRMIDCILKDLENIRSNHSLTDNEKPNPSIADTNLGRRSKPYTNPLTPNEKSK
ncbi:hypothetical protein ACTFIR_002682 [Dictyostelium discoideum]